MTNSPGPYVAGADMGMWSADCLAALMACGIDPAAAGGYDDLSGGISAKRAEHRNARINEAAAGTRDHEPNCGLAGAPHSPRPKTGDCSCFQSTAPHVRDELGGNSAWLYANSEAGHIGQDSFCRDGQRGNACSNVVPGYRPADSFTMLHHGDATGYGMHRAVTLNEKGHAAYLQGAARNGRISPREIDRGIERTARMTVNYGTDGPVGQMPRGMSDSIDEARRKSTDARNDLSRVQDARRRELAAEMRADAGSPTPGSLAEKIDKACVDPPSDMSPTNKAREKAIRCISAKAKQAIGEMQKTTVNEDSTVAQSASCQAAIAAENERRRRKGKLPPEAETFTDLPQGERRRVLDQTRGEVAARNAELEPRVRAGTASSAECLEYQGNQIAPHYRTGRGVPPVAGSPPGGNSAASRVRTSWGRRQPPR